MQSFRVSELQGFKADTSKSTPTQSQNLETLKLRNLETLKT